MQQLMILFDKYLQEGKVSEALLVGQNMFNKNRSDTAVFEKYVGALLKLAAGYKTPVEVCRHYCDKADLAVELYAENADLQEQTVQNVIEKKRQLAELRSDLAEREEESRRELLKEIVKANDACLDLVGRLHQELLQAKDPAEFDKLLTQIQKVDQKLDMEYFTERQEAFYQKVSKACAKAVDGKMRYFNHRQKVVYNLKAAEAYKKAYNILKKAENVEYCGEILTEFFSYDPSYLFNETLVYYNHVYSYILSKMDDNGKFNMTKYAIQAEKNFYKEKN